MHFPGMRQAGAPLRGGGILFWLLAILMVVYLVGPLFYFIGNLSWPDMQASLSDPDAISALQTSVVSASVSTVVMAMLGIPLGYVLARFSFPGKSLVSLLIYLPLVFPPVVSGIVLLLLYGPYGPVGNLLSTINVEVDSSIAGIMLAQIFVAAPFVIVAARSAFETVNPKLEQVAMTLGHGRWNLFWRVSLPLARGGIIAGLLLAWMRAMGEFGATVVMAYHPYTLPVYTYVQLTGTGVQSALPPAVFSLVVSSLMVGLVLVFQRGRGGAIPL
jgi:ABC-type sulfate transport system permease component